jgi:DUF2924 family protein
MSDLIAADRAAAVETSSAIGKTALEAEIDRLNGLDLATLRERWRDLCGRPAPVAFRRKFLIRALAYQMQVQAFGGLSPATKRRLREIAEAVRTGNEESVLSAPRIKPGTRLYRVWKDKTHCVTVLAEGFEWQGARHGSLSAVATSLTGTQWNGYAFFGLKRRALKNKNALKLRSSDHA